MLAAQVDQPAGPAHIVLREVPEPRPSPDLAVIDVHAAGVGHVDVVCSYGRHQLRPTFPFTPGFEVAGRLRSAPVGSGLEAGDRVAAYVDSGGYAEVAVADPAVVLKIPDGLSMATAAALPVNALTALYALLDRAELRRSETVVVHGAGGGLGTALTRVASLLGADVIGVVSSNERGAMAVAAGASGYVLADDRWVQGVRQALVERERPGADVVVDPVGGDRLAQSMRFAAPRGRLVSLGFVAGIPEVQVNRLLVRNLVLMGADWMPADPVTSQRLMPWLRGRVCEVADALAPSTTAPLAGAAPLLEALEGRRLVGKAVLTVREPDDQAPGSIATSP